MTLFFPLSLVIALATVVIIGAPLVMRRNLEDGSVAKVGRFAAFGALGLAPIAAAFLYGAIGTPAALEPAEQVAANDPVAAIAAMNPEDRAAQIEGMVAGLAARLAADPNDLGGWRMLARSYTVLGRHDDAANAWREALVLSEGAVDDWSGLAIALVESGAPAAAPAIKEAFEEVLLQKPEDPLALYFLGQAALADGDAAWAKELLTRLRVQTPDAAPIAQELDQILSELDADVEVPDGPADSSSPNPTEN